MANSNGTDRSQSRQASNSKRIVPALPLLYGQPKKKVTPAAPAAVTAPKEKVEEVKKAESNVPTTQVIPSTIEEPPAGKDVEATGKAEPTIGSVLAEVSEAASVIGDSSTKLEAQDQAKVLSSPEQTSTSPPPPRANGVPPTLYPSDTASTASLPSMDRTPHASTSSLGQVRADIKGLVFGGQRESANTSPAPAAAVQSPRPPQPMSQHSSTAGYPPSLPFVPSGHAYHLSEPPPPYHTPYTYNGPQGYHNIRELNLQGATGPQRPLYPPPSGPLYSPSRRDYNSSPRHYNPQTPPGPMYSRFPPPFVPRPSEPANNNVQKAIHTDILRDGPTNPIKSRPQSNYHFDRTPNADQDAIMLLRFINSQFGNPEFADYVLQLSHVSYLFPPMAIPAHGVLLARSPKLRSLMAMPPVESQNGSRYQNGLKMLHIPVSDRFIKCDFALVRAIMRVYGETLPDRHELVRLATPYVVQEEGSLEAAQMRFTLSFAASGHFLQMDDVISQGLFLVGQILSWNTIGKAMAFALDGGLSNTYTQSETSSKEKGSNSSLEDSPSKPDYPVAAPAYGYYSDKLIDIILAFLVHNIPMSFKFSAKAPQLNDPPRLPAVAEHEKHLRSASRSSQIRFGDMTMSDSNESDHVAETISTILVSLPFALLKGVVESDVIGTRLTWARVADLAREVVGERESRRQRAMSQRGPIEGPEDFWLTVRFVESIEPTENHPLGVRLSRNFAGSDTPPSTVSGGS